MNLLTLPKAELHRHLECSMRLSTLKELAPQVGIEIPPSDAALKEKFLVTTPMKDLESVLKKFLMTQAVIHSEEILARITYEICEDAVKEGIKIIELRYAPTFVQMGHEHLSYEAIHRGIMKGVKMAEKLPIAVGIIAIIQRILSVDVAERVTDFVIDNKDTFVGLDLADNEVGFNCVPFAPAFVRARKAGLHITVHAGESNFPEAPQSVRDAIDQLGATRIGHGLQIFRDAKMMEYLKSRRIPLEICPTSNWLTNAIPTLTEHPIRKLMAAGVPVTLNTDDPGIFDIDLMNEYKLLHEKYQFTEAEFNHSNDIAAASSFIPLAQRQKVWPRPIRQELAPIS